MAANSEQIRLARIELAKRELTRRQGASQAQPEEQGFMDRVSSAADDITATIPAVAGLMAPTLGMAQYAGQQMNEAAGGLAEPVTEKLGQGFEVFGKKVPPVPGPLAAGLGAVASVAANPLSYADPGAGISTKLGPARGKPGVAARIKQMRTGVEGSAFEQLRRDPTAFFNRTPRSEAGASIGEAKQKSGISLGVTKDPASLTPENISKARSPIGAANKAQDQIVEDLGAARELLGPGASMEELISTAGITPDQTSTALKGLNKRLTRLERTEGRGSESFRDFSAIKDHFQNILEHVAPDVKAANKDFSRVALRDKFMEPFPVNQSGTFSKINAFGFAPLMGAAGATMGGTGVGLGAMAAAQAVRSPFVAGLGTATRGLMDKVVDPTLSRAANKTAGKGGLIGMTRDEAYRKFLEKFRKK